MRLIFSPSARVSERWPSRVGFGSGGGIERGDARTASSWARRSNVLRDFAAVCRRRLSGGLVLDLRTRFRRLLCSGTVRLACRGVTSVGHCPVQSSRSCRGGRATGRRGRSWPSRRVVHARRSPADRDSPAETPNSPSRRPHPAPGARRPVCSAPRDGFQQAVLACQCCLRKFRTELAPCRDRSKCGRASDARGVEFDRVVERHDDARRVLRVPGLDVRSRSACLCRRRAARRAAPIRGMAHVLRCAASG